MAIRVTAAVIGSRSPRVTNHKAASGLNHPWTKDSARVTANALDALGRAEEAKALQERGQ